MTARPVVGISAYEEQAAWNQWNLRACVLPTSYVRSVEEAGGIPLVIPVQTLRPGDAAAILGHIDGLVLSGGPDLNPERYGAASHEKTGAPRDERDVFEIELIKAASKSAAPTLAICRGLQVLNVARGGTLVQHLPETVGHAGHAPLSGAHGRHNVKVKAGTALAAALGWDSAEVPTAHHQAIEVLGEGLEATAWAEDGTIEAVEDGSVPFLLGVQWHPEAGEDLSLFRAIVQAASR